MLGEYAFTENIDKRHDGGCLIRTEYEKRGLRVSASYVNLGEYFGAAFADPARHIRDDAHGGELSIDYISRESRWIFNSMAFSSRLIAIERHSNGENIYEGDVSVRFKAGEKDTFFMSWLGRDEDQYRINSLMGSIRHMWTDELSSGVLGGYTDSRTSYTRRGMVDITLRLGPDSYRLEVERIRRVIENSTSSPYEETGFNFDMIKEPWRLILMARLNRKKIESGSNFFGKVSYRYDLFHRYMFTGYLAVGNRAAFETEKQIEAGIEFRF